MQKSSPAFKFYFDPVFCALSIYPPEHTRTQLTRSVCGLQMATRGMRLCTSGSETRWRRQTRNTGGFTSLTSWGSETRRTCLGPRQVGQSSTEDQGRLSQVVSPFTQWLKLMLWIIFHHKHNISLKEDGETVSLPRHDCSRRMLIIKPYRSGGNRYLQS